MNNEVLICRAQAADVHTIANLFREKTVAYWTLPLGVNVADTASMWREVVEHGEVLCAWQEATLQGCSGVYQGQICFAVSPLHRRQGLASRLLAHSLERYKAQAGMTLHGVVRRGNVAAEATLLKHGFHFKGLIAYKNRHLEETLMSYTKSCSLDTGAVQTGVGPGRSSGNMLNR